MIHEQHVTRDWISKDFLGLRTRVGPALFADRLEALGVTNAHVHAGLQRGDTSHAAHLVRLALRLANRRVEAARRAQGATSGGVKLTGAGTPWADILQDGGIPRR